MAKGKARSLAMVVLQVVGFVVYRFVFDPGVAVVESINAVMAGNIGGLGLPVLVSWLIAGAATWAVARARPVLGLSGDCRAWHRADHRRRHDQQLQPQKVPNVASWMHVLLLLLLLRPGSQWCHYVQ